MEASRLPTNQKIQGRAVCRQSDSYRVLGQESVLLVDFLEKKATINAAVYGGTLELLSDVVVQGC